MKKFFLALSLCATGAPPTPAQTARPSAAPPQPQQSQPQQSQQSQQQPPSQPSQQQPPQRPSAQPRASTLDLTEYGVRFAAEPRLIVVMAALDAAGFDPAPGRAPTLFRARLRQDQAALDEALRARLRRSFELNRLKDPSAAPAREAARYVSLAFALGPAPSFEPPSRNDDELFEGVLDVLDFAPLVAEFYRRSGVEARLPAYVEEHRAEGDRMRRQTADMVRSVLNYLHTRPATTVVERVPAPPPAKDDRRRREQQPAFKTRERERQFFVIPDLLAVPGAINFRVRGDDYFVILPPGTDPSTPEVRRAFLQYVVDPLVLRFNREIALKRPEVRALLDERARLSPGRPLPDVFEAVGRSLVVAVDARMTANARLQALGARARADLERGGEPERAAITRRVQAEAAAIEDDLIDELAEAYERGAVLAFHFAERLRDHESAGFDFTDSMPDVVSRIDPERERGRPAQYAEARKRAASARELARKEAARTAAASEQTTARRAQLFARLDEVSQLLQAKNHAEAESALRTLSAEYPREPRVLFAMGQAWSVGAADAVNEETRDERLTRALENYRQAIEAAAGGDTDRPLLSRAYVAAGRILAFMERNEEAAKMFDEAIRLGDIPEGAYRDAVESRKKLQP
jgi:tetratricopeptide (TPR) repeat protein